MTETSLTVGALRDAVRGLADDLPVILSGDEEGNSFDHLWVVEVSKCCVEDDDIRPLHPDDVDNYNLEDLIDAVVLWP